MYKAVHRHNGEEILTLHPAWRGRQAELRRLTEEELLVCQGCGQTVRLKAGPRKRPHFAHRHLQGCSYGSESPRVLAGRALLYERLAECRPGQVEAEVNLPGLPRPADVLLNLADGRRTAYWVVDALMRQETRVQISAAFEAAAVRLVWLPLAHLLRPEHQTKAAARLYLSPCERACLRPTVYDEIGRENRILDAGFGASLAYLEVEKEELIFFRSLERVHAPNLYSGRRETCALARVEVDAEGELVYPGEVRSLGSSRLTRAYQGERVERWLAGRPQPERSNISPPHVPATAEPEPVTCVYCGALTSDWWAAWMEAGRRLGKCRACLDKGVG